jgi:hypothetical protein
MTNTILLGKIPDNLKSLSDGKVGKITTWANFCNRTVLDNGPGGAHFHPFLKDFQILRVAFCLNFNFPIGSVFYPSEDVEFIGFVKGKMPKPNAMNPSADEDMN